MALIAAADVVTVDAEPYPGADQRAKAPFLCRPRTAAESKPPSLTTPRAAIPAPNHLIQIPERAS